jgi:hypothetical protein
VYAHACSRSKLLSLIFTPLDAAVELGSPVFSEFTFFRPEQSRDLLWEAVMLTRTLMPRPRPRPGPLRPRPRPRPRPSRPRPRTRPSKPRPRTNKLSLLIPFLSYNILTHKMIHYNTRFPARKANLCNILLRKHAMQLQQS